VLGVFWLIFGGPLPLYAAGAADAATAAGAAAEAPVGAPDPHHYLASLYFDGADGGRAEAYFPVQGSGVAGLDGARLFNESQDANGDGVVDPEDSLENVVPFALGPAVTGTGATALPARGPNDQRPAVYYHHSEVPRWPGWSVSQYWLYYAFNDWLNRHEHEWEAYLIYFYDGVPERVRLSAHGVYPGFAWREFADRGRVQAGTHLELSLIEGAHAFHPPADPLEDGLRLGWDGSWDLRQGVLAQPAPSLLPWQVLSNDAGLEAVAEPFDPRPLVYGFGDPFLGLPEAADPRPAPWADGWPVPAYPYDRIFSDVPGGAAYGRAIESLWGAGVVDGYLNGRQAEFRPEASLLRAQFAKIIVLSFGIAVDEQLSVPFSDLGEDDPADLYPHDYVAAAAQAGITRGTQPGLFSPWSPLTRAQAVTMVVRAVEAVRPDALYPPPLGYTGSLGLFDSTHSPQMLLAESNGLLAGLAEFGAAWDPWAPMSRAEAAQLIWTVRERLGQLATPSTPSF